MTCPRGSVPLVWTSTYATPTPPPPLPMPGSRPWRPRDGPRASVTSTDFYNTSATDVRLQALTAKGWPERINNLGLAFVNPAEHRILLPLSMFQNRNFYLRASDINVHGTIAFETLIHLAKVAVPKKGSACLRTALSPREDVSEKRALCLANWATTPRCASGGSWWQALLRTYSRRSSFGVQCGPALQ